MYLFVQLFSGYCVPNPVQRRTDILYLLKAHTNFLFYRIQCADLNAHQNQMEGLTRLLGPASRVADPGQDFAFFFFFS